MTSLRVPFLSELVVGLAHMRYFQGDFAATEGPVDEALPVGRDEDDRGVRRAPDAGIWIFTRRKSLSSPFGKGTTCNPHRGSIGPSF